MSTQLQELDESTHIDCYNVLSTKKISYNTVWPYEIEQKMI